MQGTSQEREGVHQAPKTVVLSCRGVIQWLSTPSFYEFEDLVVDVMDGDLLAPADTRFRIPSRIRNILHRGPLTARQTDPLLSPLLPAKDLEAHYDLAFVVLPDLYHSYKVWDYRDLHEKCRKTACYIPECWAKLLRERPYLVEPLRRFDWIFVSTLNAVDTMQEMSGVPCSFLPFGVDAIKFSPFPFWPERQIDVYNIGRRSPVTHGALLRAVAEKDFFYVYDTVAGFECKDSRDHRTLFANTAKRSKYFISNMAEFDRDDKTGGAIEVGHRFYEGAASGAVLLGAYPADHKVIRDDFDWPDAIIKTDLDAADIVGLIEDLNGQPDRIRQARLNNVRNCLLRHDFVYRWEQVLATLDLSQSTGVAARKAELRRLADTLERDSDDALRQHSSAH